MAAPLLPAVLQPSDVMSIVGALQAGERLPRGVVAELLQRQIALLREQRNVLRVELKPAQRITVVGDLHGQLADLMHIFSIAGWPSKDSLFLFNGDFVDRGPKSVQVVLILFAWHQCFPDAVLLNRGNHEESTVNAVYGFLADCAAMYDKQIYDMFDEAFRWLPLASLIDSRTLVLHAGVATGLTINMLDELPRAKYTMEDKNKPDAAKAPHFNRVIETVLWSDPQPKKGCVANKKRGAGCRFGPDVVQEFMAREGLGLIVRSHECVMDGTPLPRRSRAADGAPGEMIAPPFHPPHPATPPSPSTQTFSPPTLLTLPTIPSHTTPPTPVHPPRARGDGSQLAQPSPSVQLRKPFIARPLRFPKRFLLGVGRY